MAEETKVTEEQAEAETAVAEANGATPEAEERETDAAAEAPTAEAEQTAEAETDAAAPAAQAEAADDEPTADDDGPAAKAADNGADEAGEDAAGEDEAGEDEDDGSDDGKKKQRGRRRLTLDKVEVGTETRGKVVGLAKFGAFVDIGAVTDGLVHISELSQKRVSKVDDVVQPGDVVDVWVKDVDLNKERISLSMRKKPKRPMDELRRGQVLTGTVTSLTKYGAFVDIGAETEGLVHVSEMSTGYVERPGDVINKGDSVEVRIKELDPKRERISLSMAGLSNDVGVEMQAGAAQAAAPAPDEYHPTVVELALRRAMGEMEDDEGEADEAASEGEPEAAATVAASEDGAGEEPVAEVEAGEPAGETPDDTPDDTLGETFRRMLSDYRESQAAEE